MANFLTQSEGSVAQSDADVAQAVDNRNRANAATAARVAAYGPLAIDPQQTGQALANETNMDEQTNKETQVANETADSNLATDQKQRADTAWQAQQVIKAAKASGDPASFIGKLDPTVTAALGVDPNHVQPLIQQIQKDPTTLDRIEAAVAPDASKSKFAGQIQWATGQDGTLHALYPMQDDQGNIAYKEPTGLPSGYKLNGMTPTQAATAATNGLKAAATGAAFTGDVKAEQVAPMIQQLVPGARITGLGRTPGQNAAVGGVANSMHLSDQAVDFVPPPGTNLQDVVNHLRAQGLPVTEALDEGAVNGQGPHFHIGWAPKPTAAQQTASTAAASGSGLSDAAITLYAQKINAGAAPPVLGQGKDAALLRAQIYQKAADLATASGDDAAALNANQQAFKERGTAVNDLGRNTPTSAGGRVQAAGALISHMQVLGGLADALGNGNIQAINQAQNAYKSATGQAAPTNMALAKTVVGDEAAKFIAVANVGKGDRDAFQAQLSAANSPAQLKGAISTLTGLASGQLGGMRARYQSIGATNEFDRALTPAARQALGVPEPGAPPASSPAATGGTAPPIPPARVSALRSKYGL